MSFKRVLLDDELGKNKTRKTMRKFLRELPIKSNDCAPTKRSRQGLRQG